MPIYVARNFSLIANRSASSLTMRILWLSHLVPYPPKGGVLQRSYYLLRELARTNDVHLVAFVQPDVLRPVFRDAEEGLREARQHLSEFCGSIAFVPLPGAHRAWRAQLLALRSLFWGSYTMNWLWSKEYRSVLRTFRRRQRADLVHVDTISLAPYVNEFPGTPKVLDHHNIESHMMLRRASMEPNPLKKFYFWQEGLKIRRYERETCPRFELNITCSDVDARRLAEVVKTRQTIVIPNGVDIDYFLAPNETAYEPHSMVFVGGLNWYPNRKAMSYFATEVWPLLKRVIPDVTMNVIGRDPPRSLLHLSERDPAFRLHGYVDDIRPYVHRAHAYVCPILEGGGTKLKVLDALAMGAALVASPEACEGLDVEHGRDVLIAHGPAEYVEHLKALFADDALRTRLSAQARVRAVEQYSFATIGHLLATAYQNLSV